jgi:hypothetical protein
MDTCKGCKNINTCWDQYPCCVCKNYDRYADHGTNSDRIRSLTDEELAKYIDVNMLPDKYLEGDYLQERAIDVILKWLKEEVE